MYSTLKYPTKTREEVDDEVGGVGKRNKRNEEKKCRDK